MRKMSDTATARLNCPTTTCTKAIMRMAKETVRELTSENSFKFKYKLINLILNCFVLDSKTAVAT